jgi:hypothetical protein
MANVGDGEFSAVADVDATCGVPYYAALSTTAATVTSLPKGRYWVRLDGVSVTLVCVGGTATIPASGSPATGTSYTLAHGETYKHAADGNLSVIAHGTGYLWLQPVAGPG